MAPYGPEPQTPGARRQVTMAAVVMVTALAVPYSSDGFQQQIALMLQGSALAPFIALQERLADGRARAEQIDFLQAELDSIVAATATQTALVDENRELRDMLGLVERSGPRFIPAALLRPGTPGSESMFLVNVGAEQGVVEGAPVVSPRGLVGRILEVRTRSAVGMDWTHPDFRASGMLGDGTMAGMIENVRGDFREEDRLMLNGTAYHETAPRGALVVTSGFGGVYPRGIPVGRIDATAEVQGSWRKSYWLEPLVDPAAVTHVLVETEVGGSDVSDLWVSDSVVVAAPAASAARPASAGQGPAGRQSGPATRPRPQASPPAGPADSPPAARPAPAVAPPSPSPREAASQGDSAGAAAAPVNATPAGPTPADTTRADPVPVQADSTARPDSAALPPDSQPPGNR